MKFKLLGTTILSSALLLTACGQDGDKSNKDDNKKSESKSAKSLMIQRKIKIKIRDNKRKIVTKIKVNQVKTHNKMNSLMSNKLNKIIHRTIQIKLTNNKTINRHNNLIVKSLQKKEIAEWDRQNVKGGTDYGLIDPKKLMSLHNLKMKNLMNGLKVKKSGLTLTNHKKKKYVSKTQKNMVMNMTLKLRGITIHPFSLRQLLYYI